MGHFVYRDGQLVCDGVPVADVARAHGTPLYVYSEAAVVEGLDTLRDAFAEVDPPVVEQDTAPARGHVPEVEVRDERLVGPVDLPRPGRHVSYNPDLRIDRLVEVICP